MSNITEIKTEEQIIDKGEDFNSTSSLRGNDMANVIAQAPAFKVKPPIPNPVNKAASEAADSQAASIPNPSTDDEKIYSTADIVRMAKQIEHNVRKSLATANYVPGSTQVINKENAPELTVDFSKLTMEDIYDLTIPIKAKPFGATDALRVELQDKNYEARWVNKNPRRLGQFLAYGFTYVEEKDLSRRLEVEVVSDAQGHFVLDDVVLMKIPKALYYAALRAAQERAIRTVNSVQAANTAKDEATKFMQKQGGSEYAELVKAGKVEFYNPGIEV